MYTMLIGPKSTKALTYGMSIGFDLLISGFEERQLPHIVIDRSQGMVGRKVGVFTLGGILATISMLGNVILNLRKVMVIYLTIGTSKAGFFRDMIMIWLAWFSRKRIVLHLKGGGFQKFYEESSNSLRFLMRRTISKANTIVVLGDLLKEQFFFVPDITSKLVVVPNGLPSELKNNRQESKTIRRAVHLNLLYLSNMIPSKGYLDLLEACHILYKEKQIPIHCDFCGAFLTTVNDFSEISPQQAEAAFKRLIENKGLENIVSYHGTVRGEEKKRILQNANVFILPTAYPWEGQPISIIEALAYGLPVISTRYRGIPEQVKDDFNGVLLEEKSPQAIADAVEKLWQNPSLYEQYSQNAISHFQQHFTREAHLSRLIPVILGHKDALNMA